MKKIIAAAAIVLAIAVAIAGSRWYNDNRKPNFNDKAELYVTAETTVDDVLGKLLPICRSEKSLRRTFSKKQVADYIKPGYYVVGKNSSSVYVARMLNNGWQSPVNLTLSGTMRLRGEIARKIANQLMLDSLTVRKAMEDKELLAGYGFTPQTVFALFQPDTYQMYWTASIKDVLDKQKEAYDAFWTSGNEAKAKALGLTKMQVSILASIVSGETRNKPEMPKVAGVYLNRLKIGMLLQADPTVAYCFDYTLNRVLLRHLQVDNPYNTYKYPGLPPGPICVPSKDCLEAVLNPDFGNGAKTAGASGCNLYFCANPDFSGTHVFARNLSEHSANARAFQAELNRRARAK